MRESKRWEGVEKVGGSRGGVRSYLFIKHVVFLKEFIALYYWYIELFTRKISSIHA